MLLFKKVNLFVILLCLPLITVAKSVLPIKVDGKWGLIDDKGNIILSPQFTFIDDFNTAGLAKVYLGKKVGLLNNEGKAVLPIHYTDIQLLSPELFAIKRNKTWKVINQEQKTILKEGYSNFKLLNEAHLRFSNKQKKVGVVDKHGNMLCSPIYLDVKWDKKGYFKVQVGDLTGLVNDKGRQLLYSQYDEIKVLQKDFIFFRKGKFWSAIDSEGQLLFNAIYDNFKPIDENLVILYDEEEAFLYDTKNKNFINQQAFTDFKAFSKNYFLTFKSQKVGLVDINGALVLDIENDEVHTFTTDLFRIKREKRWHLIPAFSDKPILDFDYIAPLKNNVALYKSNNKFGLINKKGEIITEAIYERLSWEGQTIKAFRKRKTTLLSFDKDGNLRDKHRARVFKKLQLLENAPVNENPLIVGHFQWYFDAAKSKWGLIDIETGEITLHPLFSDIKVDKTLNWTFVSYQKANFLTLDQFHFRFEHLLGIVDNNTGRLIQFPRFIHFFKEDLDHNQSVIRFIDQKGKYGLIHTSGKVLTDNITFIGDVKEGKVRYSKKGKLVFKQQKSPKRVNDFIDFLPQLQSKFTYHNISNKYIKWLEESHIECADCKWGYLDTLTNVKILPKYQHVEDFHNGSSIVLQKGKWGAIDENDSLLIADQFELITFLDKSNNNLLKLVKANAQYGIIDTMGRTAVEVKFDDIGALREDKLSVKKNGKWGFVNIMGRLVTPIKYNKVRPFHNGIAAVCIGHKWGFIDYNGVMMIDPTYKKVGNFEDGLAWVKTSTGVGYINTNGEMVIPAIYDKAHDFEGGIARICKDDKYGLINVSGDYILKPKYVHISAFNVHKLAIASKNKNQIRYIILDNTGERVGLLTFDKVMPFDDGLAPVKYNGKYGYINTEGDFIVPPIFEEASPFADGRAWVKTRNICYYINRKGEKICENKFSKCETFSSGLAIVHAPNRASGVIDTSGTMVLPLQGKRIVDVSEEKMVYAEKDYFVKTDMHAPNINSQAFQAYDSFHEDFIQVEKSSKWGVQSPNGIQVVKSKFDTIEPISDGYAKVGVSERFGIATSNGKIIVQPIFDYITYVGEGIFRVEKTDEIGYINEKGNWIWALKG